MRFLKATARRTSFGFFSSCSLINKVILIGISIITLQNNLYGLLPCRLSFRHRKFIFSKPMALYCFAVATVFGVFYLESLWKDFMSEQFNQLDAIQIYCYMNCIVVLLNYVTQWAIMRQILRFLNSIPLLSTINYFKVSFMSKSRSILFAILKMIAFPFIMQLTLILYQKQTHPELSWITTIRTIIPIILGNQLNNCFFGGIVIAQGLFMQINQLLREMLQEVNRMQTPVGLLLLKPYYRMQRFCELADQLDELARNYSLIAYYSREYLVLTSFSLVISLGINLFSTTLGCYRQFQAVADYLIIEDTYDAPRALAHFVFLLIPFLEIVLVACVSQQELNEAKEAGNLLQQMNLEHADVRFKQVVDVFWLEVCTINLKLMPMGLLELDGSMVNKMYSTVAGILLFLIQNDLNFRFSK
ncbi:hypothetical protein ACLKA7_009456 [Drosophila subpalustris]